MEYLRSVDWNSQVILAEGDATMMEVISVIEADGVVYLDIYLSDPTDPDDVLPDTSSNEDEQHKKAQSFRELVGAMNSDSKEDKPKKALVAVDETVLDNFSMKSEEKTSFLNLPSSRRQL